MNGATSDSQMARGFSWDVTADVFQRGYDMEASPKKRKQIGDILVGMGVLKSVNLEDALKRQKNSRKRLGEILQEMGVVCEKDIAQVLATQFSFAQAPPLPEIPISQELLDLVSLPFALSQLVFPLYRERDRLHLAMANPLDLDTVDKITFGTGLKVVPWISTASEIYAAIKAQYPKSSAACDRKEWKILIVEDKVLTRTAAVGALKKKGYSIFEAANGSEGLEAVLLHSPHLIIAETVMRGMDGCEMFRVLQRNPATRTIPFIGFSSRASREEETRLLNLGFFDFVSKPLNPTLLTARVERALKMVYGRAGGPGSVDAGEPLHMAVRLLLGLMLDALENGSGTKFFPAAGPGQDMEALREAVSQLLRLLPSGETVPGSGIA
jgi:CheY-like chemotaxis protein